LEKESNLQKWVTLDKRDTLPNMGHACKNGLHLEKKSHTCKNGSLGKKTTLQKMGHTCAHGSHLEKWIILAKHRSHLEKRVTFGRKNHNCKKRSQLEQWVTPGKKVILEKMGKTRKKRITLILATLHAVFVKGLW